MTEEREMTALDAPVGAGAEQSSELTPTIIPDYGENFNPSAEEMFEAQMQYEQEMQAQAQAEREAAPGFMQTVSMPELYEMVYPGKPPIIDHFLYPGTYLFVGAPKVGKSFMMAQIAYHVSSGTPMWNYSVRKGTVLYLALEDDYRRLQERLYRMFGTETTPDLFFSVASKSLNEGLLDQLGTFLNEHPETSVVIIDTLQKVREAEGDTYSYARDYDIIAGLKAFADRTGICLILVHHTRKQKSDDNFDRISGTNGLLGAADGAFIMYKNKRSDGDATIEVSGRDQPDKKFMLTRNKETLCWELNGEKSPEYTEPPEPVLEAIGNFINADNPTWEGTATELIEKLAIDIKPNALSLKLNVNAGKLYNLYFVQYSNSRSHKGRKITLRYDEDHPIIVEPELDTDDTAEDEFQYQPVDGDPKATVCYIRGDSGNKSFHDMTDAEKENFLATSY
ncbi:MAG: AAA family ATPase [Ruminococcus sp.]|nr:AAA family ATPase [Ruminococcus sp.]